MKLIQNLLIVITALIFTVKDIYAQQPGSKECFDATPLSNWETITYANTPGEGVVLNEINLLTSCLNSGERNSSWFKFYTTTLGLVSFNIIPNCDVDYDWAVFDITEGGCASLLTDPNVEVSCNFSGSLFPTPNTGPNGGTGPQDNPPISVSAGRIYVILVNNFSGVNLCNYTINFDGSTAQLGNFNEIIGHITYDNNDTCGDDIEVPIEHQKVSLLDLNNNSLGVAYTLSNGLYKLYLPSGQGAYSVELQDIPYSFEPTCYPNLQNIEFVSDTGETVDNIDFSIRSTQNCSQYKLDYSAILFRRCFTTTNFVTVSNLGTTSEAVDFTLTYPSDQIYPLSASVPFESSGSNTYVFHVPLIELFQQFIITISDTTTCLNTLGDFVCIEAELLQENTCYDEQELALKLAMNYDSISNQITIRNIGNTPMQNSFSLTLVNWDDLIFDSFLSFTQFSINLQPQEFYSTGIFNEQWTGILNDPIGNAASLTLTNTDEPIYADTLFQVPIPNTDVECAPIIGSYDPNDKQGFPSGLGELNRIEKDQSINYRIRFQNTGSDTAFTVVVLDTLSSYLDYTTIIPGASSHSYEFSMEENRLEFRFNNVDLVQKSLNEPASIGFVEFKINQKASNPISYTIENEAAIYFDFNDPIYTPIHQYSIYPLPLRIDDAKQIEMNVSPNPSSGIVAFNFTNKWEGITKIIQVADLRGRIIKTIQTIENSPNFNWNDLPSGTYLIAVSSKNGLRLTSRWTKI